VSFPELRLGALPANDLLADATDRFNEEMEMSGRQIQVLLLSSPGLLAQTFL